MVQFFLPPNVVASNVSQNPSKIFSVVITRNLHSWNKC